MYTMGTVLRHGNAEQKKRYLPGIARGELRLQAFGVARADLRHRHAQPSHHGHARRRRYVINGQKIWTSRAEYSDLMLLLARTTPRDQAKSRTGGLSVFLLDMRAVKGKGLTIRPIRTMINHATTEVFFENVRIPADILWRRRRGLPLHPLRHECRAYSDRRRSASATPSGSSTRPRPMRASAWCSAGRSDRTRAFSFRSLGPTSTCAPPN